LPRLFDRFYRVDASRSRQSGGTGLGLAICKAIVDRSQGHIQIESEPGRGTEVIVTLPNGQ
jgi:signal transduction histidine kinase